MEFKYDYTLDQKGERVIVTDRTEWADVAGERRSEYAIIFNVIKYNKDGNWTRLDAESVNIIFDPSFDNDEQSAVAFRLGNDGYHIVKVIYAGLDTTYPDSSSVMINSQLLQFHAQLGSAAFEPTTEDFLVFEEEERLGVVPEHAGFNPKLEKQLDQIWARYEEKGVPHQGKDYGYFYIGYGLLLGAISSLRQEAFAEYDRKINAALTLLRRWK
jgi:hypothetical protein